MKYRNYSCNPAIRRHTMREGINKVHPNSKHDKCLDVELDEESFECLMNKFAKENYSKSIRRIKATKATYNRRTDSIKLECKVFLRNGNVAAPVFEFKEGAADHNRAVFEAREITNIFSTRSKSTPFKFNVRRLGNNIRFESMRYRYRVNTNAGRTSLVEGRNRLKEATDPTQSSKEIEKLVKIAIATGVKRGARVLKTKGYEINTSEPYESLCKDMGIKTDTIPKSAASKWRNQGVNSVEFDAKKFALIAKFGDGKTRTYSIDENGNVNLITQRGTTSY